MNKKISTRFYHTASGASPVLEWLRSLPPDDRYEIGQDLARVEFRCPSECRFVVFYLTGYGKLGQPFPVVALHGLFSAPKLVNCLCCMALSRRPKKRPPLIRAWRTNV